MGQRAGRRSLVWKEVGAGRVRRRGDGTRVSPRSRKQAQGRRREGAGARREVGPRSALGSHSLIRSFTLDDALQGKGPLARSLKSRRVGAEEDRNNPCLACSRAVRMGVPPSIARQLAAGARVDDRASAARIAAVRQKRREGADGKVCVAVVLGLQRLGSLFPHLGVSSVDRCRAARRTRPKLIHPENCQVLLGGGGEYHSCGGGSCDCLNCCSSSRHHLCARAGDQGSGAFEAQPHPSAHLPTAAATPKTPCGAGERRRRRGRRWLPLLSNNPDADLVDLQLSSSHAAAR